VRLIKSIVFYAILRRVSGRNDRILLEVFWIHVKHFFVFPKSYFCFVRTIWIL